MTDLSLAERESLESLMQYAAEQTRTDAEKAEAQARLEQQMRDLAVMRACENGAARTYLEDIHLDALAGPETTVFDLFRSLPAALREKAKRKIAAQPIHIPTEVELIDPVTGECSRAAS